MSSRFAVLPIIFALAFTALQTTFVHAQVNGCRDPQANNYNAAATVNDGSCTYNTTSYTPPAVYNFTSSLKETSGLQWAGGSLWTFNDGGPTATATIYRISTTSNVILQTVNLDGATITDWEDIAFDGTYFYVGDFGNNGTGIRTDLKIYKFPISAIPSDYAANPTVTVPSSQVEVINFSYSDQTDFSTSTSNNTKFDCEAMIVDGGKIHLFTKNWVDVNTTHYIINGTTAGMYSAMPLETLATNYLVTAADKAPGKNIIVLLGYQASGSANHFMHLLSDYSNGYFFNGNKRRIDLPNAATMGQAEGITFTDATTGFISNEEFFGAIPSRLRSFNTAAFTPAYVLPLDLVQFTISNQNSRHLINWRFAAPVADLQVLHSDGSNNYQAIKRESSSANGSFAYEPFTSTNCYKLAWRQATGNYKYSNTVCVEVKSTTGFTNVVLRKSGELSFTMNATGTDDYAFKLISVDGKLLSQTAQHITGPGYHTVRFENNVRNEFVLVQLTGKKTQLAKLLKVQN